MNFQQINYFFILAETKNFTKAAEVAYTSQPTVSRQIQLLEGELGYTLFDRDRKPLELTRAGKVLYDGLKKAMNHIDETVQSAEIVAEGKRGSLCLAFQAGYYAEYMLLPTIERLKEAWPGIHLRFLKLTSGELVLGLRNTSIDLAFGLKFDFWEENNLVTKTIGEVETLIVMSKNHRLAKKTSLDYEDLAHEKFFLTSPNGYLVNDLFEGIFSLTGTQQVEVDCSETAYFRVLLENGLTISNPYDPYLMNNPYPASISLGSKYSDSYVCAYNPDNRNPVIETFLDFL